MNNQHKPGSPRLLTAFFRTYCGPLTGTALSALSAWMMVQGMKGLAGFSLTSQSAFADLVGIIIVIGFVRWASGKPGAK